MPRSPPATARHRTATRGTTPARSRTRHAPQPPTRPGSPPPQPAEAPRPIAHSGFGSTHRTGRSVRPDSPRHLATARHTTPRPTATPPPDRAQRHRARPQQPSSPPHIRRQHPARSRTEASVPPADRPGSPAHRPHPAAADWPRPQQQPAIPRRRPRSRWAAPGPPHGRPRSPGERPPHQAAARHSRAAARHSAARLTAPRHRGTHPTPEPTGSRATAEQRPGSPHPISASGLPRRERLLPARHGPGVELCARPAALAPTPASRRRSQLPRRCGVLHPKKSTPRQRSSSAARSQAPGSARTRPNDGPARHSHEAQRR